MGDWSGWSKCSKDCGGGQQDGLGQLKLRLIMVVRNALGPVRSGCATRIVVTRTASFPTGPPGGHAQNHVGGGRQPSLVHRRAQSPSGLQPKVAASAPSQEHGNATGG